jgi:FkbM family methyltransferase
MASRLITILTRFSGCYFVTKSIWQSVYFALKLGRNKKSTIRISKEYVIQLRKNEADQDVFLTTFVYQYHRSPFDLGQSPVIIDLGSNIGLTMVDFKQMYPSAKVIGVEMDKENYESCKVNISPFSGCTLLHAAVWKENGTINYKGEDEQSYAVEKNSFGKDGMVRCITIDDLLKENNIEKVDYIKMDIEGSEKAVLLDSTSKNWLQKVKYLSVELHDLPDMDNTVLSSNIKIELETNQFIVYKLAKHWSSLFAINKLWLPG